MPNNPGMRKPFRETLWFKKGFMQADAPPADGGDEAAPAVSTDALPIEDCYLEDGSVSFVDSFEFGVHTGRTQAIRPLAAPAENEGDASVIAPVAERVLIAEMKRTPRMVVAMVVMTALVVCGAAIALV